MATLKATQVLVTATTITLTREELAEIRYALDLVSSFGDTEHWDPARKLRNELSEVDA